MLLKYLFFIILTGILYSCSQSFNERKATQTINNKSYINPKGSYKYQGEITIKNGDTYGYFGNINIQQLTKNKIAVSFFICKGAPSYNSGSFVDTFMYANNYFEYLGVNDSSCLISFKVTKLGITVNENTSDFNFGCDFGHGVVANGFFEKTSNRTPEIKNQLIH